MPYRLAIVEDNANARTNLRSLLLAMGEFELYSFSTGNELRTALRRRNFDIVVLDYRLDGDKTGPEWVNLLRIAGYLKPSTGLILLSADASPHVIGQMIDVWPDILLLKPYNAATLRHHLGQYLRFRRVAFQALAHADEQQFDRALALTRQAIKKHKSEQKLYTDLLKFSARLHLALNQHTLAMRIFDDVQTTIGPVLWAQWGKLHCQYAMGHWQRCEQGLHAIADSKLAREKAYEWLASLSYQQKDYAKTEQYLDNIKLSELSLPATRLKSLAYQQQARVIEGLEFLQRKREYFRSSKDQFNDFTFELAEFYIRMGEQLPLTNREESLSQAKKMIGQAGRSASDRSQIQKREYLFAQVSLLNGDVERAKQHLQDPHLQQFQHADPNLIITAAKVHYALGDHSLAEQLLNLAKEKNRSLNSIASLTANDSNIQQTERRLYSPEVLINRANELGMQYFKSGDWQQAIPQFYYAYSQAKHTSAFGLNLMSALMEGGQIEYREYSLFTLASALRHSRLSHSNRQRLVRLRRQLAKVLPRLLNAYQRTI